MSALVAEQRLTWDEYLALEESTGIRHEYYDGVVHCMAGGTPRHSRIGGNTFVALAKRLSGNNCQPFNSDLRVRIGSKGHYPDAMVVCGPLQMDKQVKNSVLNPAVIFEVLSKSTEGYDRGLKFFYYRQIPSLTDYVLIAPKTATIEHHERQPDGSWLLRVIPGDGQLSLKSISCEIPGAEFFEGTESLPDE